MRDRQLVRIVRANRMSKRGKLLTDCDCENREKIDELELVDIARSESVLVEA
jgi:hypothetical protein